MCLSVAKKLALCRVESGSVGPSGLTVASECTGTEP